MPFRPTDLFRRTPAGVTEIEAKSHRYTQSERLILVLLDGRLTVAGLQTRLPRLTETRIADVLQRLLDDGLIHDEPLPPPGAPSQPMRLAPDAVSAFLEQQDLDPLTRPLDIGPPALVDGGPGSNRPLTAADALAGVVDSVASAPAAAAGDGPPGAARMVTAVDPVGPAATAADGPARGAGSAKPGATPSGADAPTARTAERRRQARPETVSAGAVVAPRAAPSAPPQDRIASRKESPRAEQASLLPKAMGASTRSQPAPPSTLSGPASQFAITTINVPDRLDLQHENDRRVLEEADTRRVQALKSHRGLRLAALAALGAAVLGAAYQFTRPMLDEISATRLSQRLTAAAGVPVVVGDSDFRFTPTPHLALSRVTVAESITLEQVELQVNWPDVWRAARGGAWVWGEASVGPLKLTPAEGALLVRSAIAAGAGLPRSVSTVRFRSVQFPGVRLLPGHYEAVVRRVEGRFADVVVTSDANGAELQLRPMGAGPDAPIGYTFEAQRWAAPVGPAVRWAEARATGQFDATRADINFALKGLYGVVTGSAQAVGDGAWGLAGNVDVTNVDLEAVAGVLRGSDAGALTEGVAAPFQGTLSAALLLSGKGPTLDEALAAAVLAGPFSVRWAQLNGVNLGLAATQGSLGGGITRFTDFSGRVAASAMGLVFTDTGGKAGALTARADFRVSPSKALDGSVRVALGGQTVQAPVSLRLRGTAEKPSFSK